MWYQGVAGHYSRRVSVTRRHGRQRNGLAPVPPVAVQQPGTNTVAKPAISALHTCLSADRAFNSCGMQGSAKWLQMQGGSPLGAGWRIHFCSCRRGAAGQDWVNAPLLCEPSDAEVVLTWSTKPSNVVDAVHNAWSTRTDGKTSQPAAPEAIRTAQPARGACAPGSAAPVAPTA